MVWYKIENVVCQSQIVLKVSQHIIKNIVCYVVVFQYCHGYRAVDTLHLSLLERKDYHIFSDQN